MKKQHYGNHTRLSPTFHGFTLPALLILIIGVIRNLIYSTDANRYDASLLVLITVILASLYYHSRIFALKVQDRAIITDVRLRHFILTGKPLAEGLRTKQIIALRFASDEELPGLSQRALEEKLSNKEIKKQIRKWKGDY
ncbi:MAG: DUF6526 family protein, partial [Flavisolibacter sp.]